ncbi:unnamed protein product [Clavelina lepadiformis]|uniref:Uncharacterized protein n=1 Tax=Clavelina lepadiformis TaxID=159417 RepID=A0ABP0FFZ0_CLALP
MLTSKKAFINSHSRNSDWYLIVLTPREKANDPLGGRDPQIKPTISIDVTVSHICLIFRNKTSVKELSLHSVFYFPCKSAHSVYVFFQQNRSYI